MNLISNSIKFTKKGGIVIKVTKILTNHIENAEEYLNVPFKTNFKQKISDLLDENELSHENSNTAENVRV